MEYMTTAEAAEKWGVTPRQVQRLLANRRIPHTQKHSRAWMIPADTERPDDLGREKKHPQEKSLFSELSDILAATTMPMPIHNPAAILDTVAEERLRLHYEAELAYLCGDFERTKRCYQKMDGDDASRLRASSVTIAASISTGDYPLYLEVETFLKGFVKTNTNDGLTAFADLMLTTAHVSVGAVNMVPGWLKDGDFSALMSPAKLDALYKRTKCFQFLGQFEAMLAVAQTALEFYTSKSAITFHGIYFQALCAMACCALRRADEAKRWLLKALEDALPHGFITPFAESVTGFCGLLEQCLEQEYPEYYDTIIKQWERTFINWRIFHNRFTKSNITLILSLRNYQIAQQVAHGVPYKIIAERFHMSLGTLNNKMQVIYETLFISGKNRRQELAKYIW